MSDKLEERLRFCGTHVCKPDEGLLLEAADEITRLKGEVERLMLFGRKQISKTLIARRRAEAAESTLAAKQALIDELVEGLTDIGSTSRMPRRIRTLSLALISKARSSGKDTGDVR